MMKKKFKLGISIVSVIIIGAMILGIAEKNNIFNIKGLGNEEYYVQIKEDGEKKLNGSFNYYYKATAYNKDGDEIKVEFFADKNLTKGAFLCVDTMSQSHNKINSIESYREVQLNELPEKVKEKLHVNE